MLNSIIITITIESIEYNIFISPFSLHSKKQLDIKSEKFDRLFFYNQLKDNEYETKVQQNFIDKQFISDKYIINYGQDFEKYYLGSCKVDFDSKRLWQWEGNSNKFREEDAEVLADYLFNHSSKHQSIIMFTPTKPSDINLTKGPINF
ncbi:MAG TPA: hypothetical protein VF602_13390 [Pedobacter sp.]|jgi:hypothetical protein